MSLCLKSHSTLDYTTVDGAVYACAFYEQPDAECTATGTTLETFARLCTYTKSTTSSSVNYDIPCAGSKPTSHSSKDKASALTISIVDGHVAASLPARHCKHVSGGTASHTKEPHVVRHHRTKHHPDRVVKTITFGTSVHTTTYAAGFNPDWFKNFHGCVIS
ncbi:hypothetical protein RQP46_007433 [Phenoliferia psychrophenolica]